MVITLTATCVPSTCQVQDLEGACISCFFLPAVLGDGRPQIIEGETEIRRDGGVKWPSCEASAGVAGLRFLWGLSGSPGRLSRTHEVPFLCIIWLDGIFSHLPNPFVFLLCENFWEKRQSGLVGNVTKALEVYESGLSDWVFRKGERTSECIGGNTGLCYCFDV